MASDQRSISSYFGGTAPSETTNVEKKKLSKGRSTRRIAKDSDDEFTPSASTETGAHDIDDTEGAATRRKSGRRLRKDDATSSVEGPAEAMDIDDTPKVTSAKRAFVGEKEDVLDTAAGITRAMSIDAPTTADDTSGPPPAKKKFNFWERQARSGPVAPGSKAIPIGADNCLKGLTFVFTGELSSISREEATDLAKRYSAQVPFCPLRVAANLTSNANQSSRHTSRVTGAPSSRTSYVVVGADAGEKKLEKVRSLGIPTLDEDGFLDLIRKSSPKEDDSMEQHTAVQKSTPTESLVQKAQELASVVPAQQELWTDRYSPKTTKELCGNKSNVEKLGQWLRDWAKGRRMEQRAVLISGPPGIGKTTAARLVSIAEGFDVVEFNASDARNKKSLESGVGELISSRAIGTFDSQHSELRHRVVIMDEVDGMSAGDRGGMVQLIQYIKKTKVPIICICNDRQSPKVRSLSNYCVDMRFRRPDASAIRSRIMTIAFKEGLKLQANVIDHLVASTHSDIRQMINILSAWKLARSSINYDEAKQIGKSSEKYIALGPFDVIGKYLQGQAYNATGISEKIELYFHDFSITPLMVQENYLRVVPAQARMPNSSPRDTELRTLELAASASDAISQSDLISRAIHGAEQRWELLPAHAVLSCVLPSFFMHGGMQGMYQFPSWLGQNSKANKMDRLLAEVQGRMRARTACDKRELRESYVPVLSQTLIHPLLAHGNDGITNVIDQLDAYYLSRDDWETLVTLRIGSRSGDKMLKSIPTAVKSAFTRTYNKRAHPTVVIAKPPTKSEDATNMHPDLEEAPEQDDETPADSDNEDEEQDGIAKDALISRKTKTAAGNTSKRGSKRGRAK